MNIQKQFNRAATQYDYYSIIQKKMAEELLLLAKEDACSYASILDVGCGTGLLTEVFHYAFPHAHISAIDIAENMLRLARKKLALPNILFSLQDVESTNWDHHTIYDIIISNAVFQWLEQPHKTIECLAKQLHPGGQILASTFGPETFQELASVFQEVEQEMKLPTYSHHLPMKDANEWSLIFKNAGIPKTTVIEKKVQLPYKDCREFLQAVKAIGASSSQSKHSLATQKRVLTEVIDRYNSRYRLNSGVYCTYHLYYLQGRKN